MTAIVYIEDDEFSRRIMSLLLTRKMGYSQVTLLEDSTDFLQKIEALPDFPDVIFVDIHMQPHNGFYVLETLRGVEKFGGVKIVAVTASVMNEEVELLRQAGFDGVIGKPLDTGSFPELFERLLKGEKVWRPT